MIEDDFYPDRWLEVETRYHVNRMNVFLLAITLFVIASYFWGCDNFPAKEDSKCTGPNWYKFKSCYGEPVRDDEEDMFDRYRISQGRRY